MALFGKGNSKEGKGQGAQPVRPVIGREAYCMACRERRPFSRCWMRVAPLTQCQCCGTAFENPAELYAKNQPACPKCGELLEQPGFEYGLCDTCGSKHEVMAGTKPSLLPNRKQRAEMEKHGKSWSPH